MGSKAGEDQEFTVPARIRGRIIYGIPGILHRDPRLALFEIAHRALMDTGRTKAALDLREGMDRFSHREVRCLAEALGIPHWKGRTGAFTGRDVVPGWGKHPRAHILFFDYIRLRRRGFTRTQAFEELQKLHHVGVKRIEKLVDQRHQALRKAWGSDPFTYNTWRSK